MKDYFNFLNVGKGDKFSKIMSQSSNNILKKIKFDKGKDINEYEDIEKSIKNMLGEINVDDNSQLDNLFKDIQLPICDEKKFSIIDDLTSSLQLIKKIIKVYRNNILMTEGIKYNFLFYKPTETGESSSEDYKRYIIKAKEIIDYYDFAKILKNDVVNSLLSYGKYYIEIVDISKIKIEYDNYISEENNRNINGEISKLKILNEKISSFDDFNQSDYKLLTDNIISFNNDGDNYENNTELDEFFSDRKYYTEDNNNDTDFNFLFTEKKTKDDKIAYFKDKNKSKIFDSSLSNIIINKHKPSDIIEIRGQNDNIFGYVQISTDDRHNDNINVNQNVLSIIKRLNNNINNPQNSSKNNHQDVLKNLTKFILQKTVKKYNIKIKNKNSSMSLSKHLEKEFMKKLEPEIHNNLRKIIISANKDEFLFNKLNVRFIFPSDMIVYDIGEGVVEKLIYPGKLYLLTQLSNIMMKISRAPLTRVWKIEAGQRTNYRKIIDGFKRNLRNSRTSVDQLLTTSSSKFLTDFKDHISVSYNGQESVTPTVSSLGDANIKMNDLEDLRREIIGLSEVPAQLLGVSDGGGELREHLVYTNINFATEIINIQEVINTANNKLVNRISNMIIENKKSDTKDKDKMSQYVNISLLPPVVLLLQLIEGSLSSIERIYQTFKSADENISFKYLVETFCPYMDYTKIEQLGKVENIKKAAKLAQGDPNDDGF